MNELIRKALLGDKQAQEECTRQGIVLPCPFCGGTNITKIGMDEGIYIENDEEKENFFKKIPIYACDFSKGGCGSYAFHCGTTDYVALNAWNTRPAPPIGRCGECKHFDNEGKYPVCWHTGLKIRSGDYFCSYFESKESKENGL